MTRSPTSSLAAPAEPSQTLRIEGLGTQGPCRAGLFCLIRMKNASRCWKDDTQATEIGERCRKVEKGQLPWEQEKGATRAMICHCVLFQSRESVKFLDEPGISVSAGWLEARASSGI